jgi:hypothetical protein
MIPVDPVQQTTGRRRERMPLVGRSRGAAAI